MKRNTTSQSAGFNSRLLLALVFCGFASAAASARGNADQRALAFASLPLSFEPNLGQIKAEVHFMAKAVGGTFHFNTSGFVSSDFSMEILGGNRAPKITGLERMAATSNYFIGNDPSKWRTDIPHYAQLRYDAVYPGVDLIFHGNEQRLEYDFVVAPGSDPRRIRLRFARASRLRIDKDGALIVTTRNGHEITQHAPLIYQEIDHKKRSVAGRYLLKGPHEVGFAVAAYDQAHSLVIDPVLTYSTYLGGSTALPGSPVDNGAQAIAVDASGNMYVTGFTSTLDFPTAGPEQPVNGGGLYDVFVSKIDVTNGALVYSTYLGGVNAEKAFAIAVGADGSAYITGFTQSPDFPVTLTAFQPTSTVGIESTNSSDAFVTKLSPAGNALVYSTFLGGTNAENGFGIAVDASGNAYVTGETASTDFPVQNAFQPTLSMGGLRVDAFITKLSADGSSLVYSTYLGGGSPGTSLNQGINQGFGIAVDAAGSAYVAGYTNSESFPTQNPLQPSLAGNDDVFVTKFIPAGDALVYSTYLGGSGNDDAFGIAVDSAGNAYITGKTASTDFPTLNPLQPVFGGGAADAFIAKLNPSGTGLVYSTYLGGSGDEGNLSRIALDAGDNTYIVGTTNSKDFPTANAIEPTKAAVSSTVFVTKINATGDGLVYSTYLGGKTLDFGFGIAVDSSGNTYVCGQTFSSDFPTVNPLQASRNGSDDAFIARIFEPPPVQLVSMASRKTHADAGTFDIDLPLTGSPGIECRSGGANGDYTLVFTFANPLTTVDGVSVTNGTGTATGNIDTNDAHNYIVNLTGVTNAQRISVSLTNVSDSAGKFSASVPVSMGVLIGDVNATGRTDSGDVTQVRNHTVSVPDQQTFRFDVNVSGRIDAGDVTVTRNASVTVLP
jgi:hypothetical protein